MWRDDARLLDILLAARKVVEYSGRVDFDRYERSEQLQSAINYQLVVIGEAARAVSPERKSQLPDIPWRQIVGLRNLLAHEYFRVNVKTVWRIVTEDVPRLIEQVEPVVPKEGDRP